MVILPQPVIDIDDSNLFGNELAWGETIHFENLEFITDRFDNLSFSLEGNDQVPYLLVWLTADHHHYMPFSRSPPVRMT
jgi:hypothetical protein